MTKVRVTEMVKITQEVELGDSQTPELLRQDWEEMTPGDRLYYFNELMSYAEAEEVEHTYEVTEIPSSES